jgi:hypothetical protein
MTDWSTLHALNGNQQYAFEELCFQIVKELHGRDGVLVRVDDSGGGDGVEFYLTRPNGEEWGWQSKFYPDGRISSRYDQIRQSLARACEVHPRMTKWFLCAPGNLTVQEDCWFFGKPLPPGHKKPRGRTPVPLPLSIPNQRVIDLEYWGDSQFTAWLSEPRFVGKKHFFFGELELSLEWFSHQFRKHTASLKDKFNPNLHIESQIDSSIHNILGDEVFFGQVESELAQLESHVEELESSARGLDEERPSGIGWGATEVEFIQSPRI